MPELRDVDHAFRHYYGRLVANLTRVFGPARIDLVEDVVQEAMLKAMKSWPFSGVPDHPEAWLGRVARNLAVDVLRRTKLFDEHAGEVASLDLDTTTDPASRPVHEVRDDSLRMIFTCCHPALPPDSRLALTLKTLCGFGTREIASALLTKEATVAQRLTRAKAKLQRDRVPFEVPTETELGDRLDSVLEVIYLVFNEGYRAHRGAELVRVDLVHEAIRLAELLTELEHTDRPRVHALLALMLFLGARLPARVGKTGELLTLAEQDRSLWDAGWTQAAMREFERSIRGDELSDYHIEAAIASLHAMAPSYAETAWPKILQRYDELIARNASPVARLNRSVAIAKVEGLEPAIDEIERLRQGAELAEYVMLPVTAAHFHWLAGRRDRAALEYRRALDLHCTEPERTLIRARLEACESGALPPLF